MNTFIKKRIDELAGGDPFSSGGDQRVTNDTEIQTGPVAKSFDDNSEYQKGEPPTTDKVVNSYRQNLPWFYNYFSVGTHRNGSPMLETKTNVIKKKAVEEKIEDLVKKSKSSDLTDKDYNPKVSKIIDNINDMDFSEEQLDALCKTLESKRNDVNKPKKI